MTYSPTPRPTMTLPCSPSRWGMATTREFADPLHRVIKLAGFDAVDPGLHLSAGEQHNPLFGLIAVAHRDTSIAKGGNFHASPVIATEAAGAPEGGRRVCGGHGVSPTS